MPKAVNCPDEGFDAYIYKYHNNLGMNFWNSISYDIYTSIR